MSERLKKNFENELFLNCAFDRLRNENREAITTKHPDFDSQIPLHSFD